MANDPQISIQFGGDETSINFPSEGVTTSAAVESLGNQRYRLCSVPLFVESATFMDIIEAETDSDEGLTFLQVVEHSKWRVFDFMLSRDFISSGKLEPVLSRADEFGAHWERVFGGVLYICVPPNVVWDPTPELVG